jgi:phage antirepressor YoqD-like protein
MDRKGFMLLAMGFTGAEALQWKVKLIDAFDYLEARVRELESQPQFTIPKTLGDALRLAGELSDRAEKAEQEATRLQIVAAAMKPDAEAFVRLASTPGSFKASIVAKALKMPVKEFYRWLREDLKWVFYETHHGTPRNIPYATVEKKGHATVDMAKAKIRGQEVSIPVLKITALGASVLAKKRNIYDSDMKERLKIATSSQGQLELNEAGNE